MRRSRQQVLQTLRLQCAVVHGASLEGTVVFSTQEDLRADAVADADVLQDAPMEISDGLDPVRLS